MGLLIERFFREATGRGACARIGAELLRSTTHLVRARSAAVGAAQCIFQARLGETMGVRGFYHSVLPGKGVVLHYVLSVAFPRAFRAFAASGFSGAGTIAEEAVESALTDLESSELADEVGRHERYKLSMDASQMVTHALDFVVEAFRAMAGESWEESLGRAFAFTEMHMLSYVFHVWGVPDAVVEDPEGGRAVVIEWKTYAPEGKSPAVYEAEHAQAFVYALLEAERLYSDPDPETGVDRLGFSDYVGIVLGERPDGRGARVVPAVVKPVRSARAAPVISRHPLTCTGVAKREKCDYNGLERLLAKIVLAAEHLVLTQTDLRRALRDRHVAVVEEECSVKARGGSRRLVFRMVPSIVMPDGYRLSLIMGNPLRRPLKYPCTACVDVVREACRYYVSRGGDLAYVSDAALRRAVEEALSDVRRRAWRARFSVYGQRENALRPYYVYRMTALQWGVDGEWIRGRVKTRILGEGYRVDYFDEARVEGGELVLARPPLEWEVEESHLATLREGKPAVVILREGHVRDPLLRLNFHGVVSSTEYDAASDRVVVRVRPANRPSAIYPLILEEVEEARPGAFKGVVAMEANVELTQLELLGITGFELGTAWGVARAAGALEAGEALEAEEILSILFGGARLPVEGGAGGGGGG